MSTKNFRKKVKNNLKNTTCNIEQKTLIISKITTKLQYNINQNSPNWQYNTYKKYENCIKNTI